MSSGDNEIHCQALIGKRFSATVIMDDMHDAGVTFWNRNAARLRGAIIFFAIALAVSLVIGLGVHKSNKVGKKAPALVNHLPVEGKESG